MNDDDNNQSENDDWVAGGELGAESNGLDFFSGQCIQIDTSQLPEPPDNLVA